MRRAGARDGHVGNGELAAIDRDIVAVAKVVAARARQRPAVLAAKVARPIVAGRGPRLARAGQVRVEALASERRVTHDPGKVDVADQVGGGKERLPDHAERDGAAAVAGRVDDDLLDTGAGKVLQERRIVSDGEVPASSSVNNSSG
jgi:hypothetical protein